MYLKYLILGPLKSDFQKNALGSENDWPLAFSLKAAYTQEILAPWPKWKPAVDMGTHPLRLLVREDTCGPSGCEIAVDFEGVPGASLVGIDPVFTWISEAGRQIHENGSRDSSRSHRNISV